MANTDLALFKGVMNPDEMDAEAAGKGMSDQWYIWRIGYDFEYAGEYKNVPPHAELGLVFSVDSLKTRILEEHYNFVNGYYGVDR